MPEPVFQLLVFVLRLVLSILGSNITVVLALLAAVLGLLNYLYTRRTLRLASRPVLEVWVDTYVPRRPSEFWPSTHLQCLFKNASNSVSISDVHTMVFLAWQRQRSYIWRPRWVQWCVLEPLPSLNPLGGDTPTTEAVYPEGLEQFLTKNTDSILEQDTVLSYPGRPNKLGYYHVKDPRPIRAKLRVEYRAGLPGARTQTLSVQYQLLPKHGYDERGSLTEIDHLQEWSLR